jgi:hypothetical protein
MPEAELNFLKGTTRTVGRVDAVEPGVVTISTPVGNSQRITTTLDTVVMSAAPGTLRDLRAGDRIVVKSEAGAQAEAIEVVVLPAGNLIGTPVVAVAPDSITTKDLYGKLVTMNTVGARIELATLGTLSDVEVGSTILVRAKVTDAASFDALEILVLPDGTAFGS